MATSIVYSSTTTGGKSLSKSIADVNPDISNGTAKEFVNKLNALTTNTVDSISRVDKTDIPTDATYYDVAFNITIDPTGKGSIDGNTVTFAFSELPNTADIVESISVAMTTKVNNISFMPTDIVLSGGIGSDGSYTLMDTAHIIVILQKPTDTPTTDQTLTVTVPPGSVTSGNNTYYYNAATVTIKVTV